MCKSNLDYKFVVFSTQKWVIVELHSTALPYRVLTVGEDTILIVSLYFELLHGLNTSLFKFTTWANQTTVCMQNAEQLNGENSITCNCDKWLFFWSLDTINNVEKHSKRLQKDKLASGYIIGSLRNSVFKTIHAILVIPFIFLLLSNPLTQLIPHKSHI